MRQLRPVLEGLAAEAAQRLAGARKRGDALDVVKWQAVLDTYVRVLGLVDVSIEGSGIPPIDGSDGIPGEDSEAPNGSMQGGGDLED